FASNGPLLGFHVEDHSAGDEIKLPAGGQDLHFTAALRSIVPVDHLEVVFNGKVLRAIDLAGDHTTADFQGAVPVTESGWLVLRAWSEKASDPILDIYPYATTSPIYVTVDEKPVHSTEDAQYFVAWLDKVIEAAGNHPDYNTEDEKKE